jgi:ribonuclease BN (tRNA processing enzyme)
MLGQNKSAYPYLSRYLDGSDVYQILVQDVSIEKPNIQRFEPVKAIKISTIPVHHGQLPALAWRIDIAHKSIVFSGDMNGDYKTLPLLAKNADLLIAHNAVSESASGVARNLHMPPSVIADIANQAQVKQLVLSHRMHRTLGKEKQTLEIIGKKFKGPVHFANDLDCFVPGASLSKAN